MNVTAKVRDVLDICRDQVALWKMSVAIMVVTLMRLAEQLRDSR